MARKMSNIAMRRYPIYLKALRKFKNEGQARVQSKELAEITNIDAATIRRDFQMLGKFGTKGKGYNVLKAIGVLSKRLGLGDGEKLILVGTSKLGMAMLNYNDWNDVVGEIVCAFDENPKKSQKFANVPVYSIRDIKKKIPKDCRIAILCVSRNAQHVADLLTDNGIKAIINFTTEHFSVPKGVHVNNVDIISDIQEMVVKLNLEKAMLEKAEKEAEAKRELEKESLAEESPNE